MLIWGLRRTHMFFLVKIFLLFDLKPILSWKSFLVQKKMQNHKPGILSKNGHQIFSVTFWVIRKKYPHAYVWVKIDKVSLCLEWTSVALDSGSGSQKMAFVYREQQSYRSAWLKLCGNSSKMPKTPKLWEHFYESSGNTSWQPAERNSTRTPFLCRWHPDTVVFDSVIQLTESQPESAVKFSF